jgi:adenylate cyclase
MGALLRDEAVIGWIIIYRQEVRPFSSRQIALLENFAAQAVIAMENARLIAETREALEQQTAMAEVLQEINANPGNLRPVFDAMLDKARRLTQSEFSSLATYDGSVFHLFSVDGSQPETLAPEPGSALHDLVFGATFVHIPDVADDDAYRARQPGRVLLVEKFGARTCLWIPLRKDGALLGTLAAWRREVQPFADRQITWLQNFAAQAVVAMENARLLDELRQRTDQVAELNRGLEARVAEQVEELGRVGRLKRFLALQLAELIVSQGNEKILESHRREIVVVFCDLRGYTAFTETAEPEEVLDFLRDYHGALGPLVAQFEGTLDQFSGDGIMVFFNDPVPVPDPAERAVKMAVAMRETASTLISSWRRLGRELGFGAGIAQGYATLGQIGFSERSGYTAIGTVCNVAARLCAEAKDGQILLSQRVAARLNDNPTLEEMGALTLKGLTQPVVAYNVPLAATQPALRVIDGGPPRV